MPDHALNRSKDFKGDNEADYKWFSACYSLPLISMNADRRRRLLPLLLLLSE
jgi:hypothetical protein